MPDAPPVFVDLTGRRRRHVRVAAVVAAGSLLGIGALLVVALLGVPVGPAAYLPEPDQPPPPATSQETPVVQTAPSTETTPSKRPAPTGGQSVAPVVPGTGPVAVPAVTTTTTTASKGKPDTPPGRPSDLPTPPGHTR